MPSYTRGIGREEVWFVKIKDNADIYYGFNRKDFDQITGVSLADLAVLGHIPSGQIPANGIRLLRANSPKPARVKKTVNVNPTVSQQGSISTFCGDGNVGSAIAEGWKLVKGSTATRLTSNTRTITAIAVLSNGALYGFPMNKSDFDQYSGELGLESPETLSLNTEAELFSVFTGTSYPRPGKASKTLNTGSISAFYSSNNRSQVIQSGWSIDTAEVLIG